MGKCSTAKCMNRVGVKYKGWHLPGLGSQLCSQDRHRKLEVSPAIIVNYSEYNYCIIKSHSLTKKKCTVTETQNRTAAYIASAQDYKVTVGQK